MCTLCNHSESCAIRILGMWDEMEAVKTRKPCCWLEETNDVVMEGPPMEKDVMIHVRSHHYGRAQWQVAADQLQ